MKVTFPGGLAQYFKPDTKPEHFQTLSEGLIPHSELIVYAKTSGIDPACLDWWSRWDEETSKLSVVVLDMCGMDAPVTNYDVLVIRQESGVDVIKAVDDIGVTFDAETYFYAGLRRDDSSHEDVITRIEFVKRLTATDWGYYKDLMHRSDKALRLFHGYEEVARQQRADEKKELRPKWIWPILCLGAAAFLFFYINPDYWFVRVLAVVLLLQPTFNALIKLVKYLRYKA